MMYSLVVHYKGWPQSPQSNGLIKAVLKPLWAGGGSLRRHVDVPLQGQHVSILVGNPPRSQPVCEGRWITPHPCRFSFGTHTHTHCTGSGATMRERSPEGPRCVRGQRSRLNDDMLWFAPLGGSSAFHHAVRCSSENRYWETGSRHTFPSARSHVYLCVCLYNVRVCVRKCVSVCLCYWCLWNSLPPSL